MKTLPFANSAHAAAGAPGGWLGRFLHHQAAPLSFGRRLWSYWPVAAIFLAGAAAGHYTRPAPGTGTGLHPRPAAPGRYHVTHFDPGSFRFLMVDEITGTAWFLTDPNTGWLPLDPPRPLAPE